MYFSSLLFLSSSLIVYPIDMTLSHIQVKKQATKLPYIFWLKQQAGNVHVCKNKINNNKKKLQIS